MEKEIIEGNKLISEFMGMKSGDSHKYPLSPWIQSNGNNLEYHSNWSWIMPVIEKIESDSHCNFSISSQIEYIDDDSKVIIHQDIAVYYDVECIVDLTSKSTKIEALWLAIIQFIKWYNTHHPSGG